MKILAGQTITFEEGEYSDFTYSGPFTVLNDFDQQEVVDAFKDQFVPVKPTYMSQAEWERTEDNSYYKIPSSDQFKDYLIRQGLIQDIENNVQWYLSHGYRGFNPEIM